MPSHREGFGMPVLEAGLLGKPIVASTAVPAASEIGQSAVLLFDPDQMTATQLAQQIDVQLASTERVRLARQVRQRYTWDAIFRIDIEPLLNNRKGCLHDTLLG
jgi:glycosyltransferase involved in cell wall biosynthesis